VPDDAPPDLVVLTGSRDYSEPAVALRPPGNSEEHTPTMAREHDSMMDPPIENLLDRVDSKFSLVTLAARRAREINKYFSQLGDGLGSIVPPQVSSIARKPLSIAFEEISADKIEYRRPEPAEAVVAAEG
jgi:DNA-directed RNA polymerase subunit omega